jgi:hypothetical protein
LRLLRLFAALKIVANMNDPDRYQPIAATAATKANGRQDEQDLQDGFYLSRTHAAENR